MWGSCGFLGAVLLAGAWFEHAGFAGFPTVLLAALVATALAMLALPEAPRAPVEHEPVSLRSALSGVIGLFAVLLLMQLSFGPYYGFFSLFLGELGWAPSAVGALWALAVVAEIVAFALLPAWQPRVAPLVLLELACALTALRWLLTALLADRIAWLVVAQLLHFASFAVYHAVTVRLVLGAFPGRLAGRGQALHATVAYGIGGAAGVAASGWLWDAAGSSSPFLFGAAAATLAWIGTVWLGRRWVTRSA